MTISDIPGWVEEQRMNSGQSVMQFSKATGITRSTIHSIETGVRSPNLSTFLIMLDNLGFEMDIKQKGKKNG